MVQIWKFSSTLQINSPCFWFEMLPIQNVQRHILQRKKTTCINYSRFINGLQICLYHKFIIENSSDYISESGQHSRSSSFAVQSVHGYIQDKLYCDMIWKLMSILSQWAQFSMSVRNFIGSGQSSAHPLLDDRCITHSGIALGNCIFNARIHIVWHVCTQTEFTYETNTKRWFWFLGLKH